MHLRILRLCFFAGALGASALACGPGDAESPGRTPLADKWLLRADASAQLLFCENETNNERLFGVPNGSPYVKDGIDEFVVHGAADAVNPERTGTKVAADHVLPLETRVVAGAGLRLPSHPEQLLTVNYGEDWRIPDPLFTFDWTGARSRFATFVHDVEQP